MKNTILFLSLLLIISCKPSERNMTILESPFPMIVYKTKADYSNLVPIRMNEARTKIISFPGPKDLIVAGELGKPIKLTKGYFLDNLGIDKNTVYTSYTLEEYSKMESYPALEEMLEHIIDRHPFSEMYNCGNRTGENASIEALTSVVKNNFKNCKDLLTD